MAYTKPLGTWAKLTGSVMEDVGVESYMAVREDAVQQESAVVGPKKISKKRVHHNRSFLVMQLSGLTALSFFAYYGYTQVKEYDKGIRPVDASMSELSNRAKALEAELAHIKLLMAQLPKQAEDLKHTQKMREEQKILAKRSTDSAAMQ